MLILIKAILHCPQSFSVQCTADFSINTAVHTSVAAVQTVWGLATSQAFQKRQLEREGRNFLLNSNNSNNLCLRVPVRADLSQFPKSIRELCPEKAPKIWVSVIQIIPVLCDSRKHRYSCAFPQLCEPVWAASMLRWLWARAAAGRWAARSVSMGSSGLQFINWPWIITKCIYTYSLGLFFITPTWKK